MAIDLVQYADIYGDVRGETVVPGIRRTGADPEDGEAVTYAIYTVTYDSRTGQPLPPEVVGVNRSVLPLPLRLRDGSSQIQRPTSGLGIVCCSAGCGFGSAGGTT